MTSVLFAFGINAVNITIDTERKWMKTENEKEE